MRLASWNVNGIRAVHRKEMLPWDVLPDADVIAIQETKVALIKCRQKWRSQKATIRFGFRRKARLFWCCIFLQRRA